jgi:hypothetical protein
MKAKLLQRQHKEGYRNSFRKDAYIRNVIDDITIFVSSLCIGTSTILHYRWKRVKVASETVRASLLSSKRGLPKLESRKAIEDDFKALPRSVAHEYLIR